MSDIFYNYKDSEGRAMFSLRDMCGFAKYYSDREYINDRDKYVAFRKDGDSQMIAALKMWLTK